MTFFSEKISTFTAKISDDLFLVIDQVFLIFPFLFLDFPYLYCVKCRIRPFLPKKNHYFRKEFLDDTYFYSVRTFALIRQHYFSKYWGETDAWAVHPTSNFGGIVPPVPLGFRPWIEV